MLRLTPRIQVFIYMTVVQRFLSAPAHGGHRLRGGNAKAWWRMPGASCNNTLTSLLFPLPTLPRFTFSSSGICPTRFYPSPHLLAPNPFFFVSRQALDCIIQYSYFHLHYSSSLNSALKKSCLSLAWWIIIPSSVSPCQSINLTCHLLSFLSSSVKGWPPLLSLYLSVSLCVQIPRLSPPDWIIQFRCHLFHSWQWGLCALSSV